MTTLIDNNINNNNGIIFYSCVGVFNGEKIPRRILTMNIPFPVLTPRLVDPSWFNADSPCDEETELTTLEQANQHWLNSIGQQYMKRAPLGKADPEPMEEEADTDEEEGNDESDESEDSHDEDEEDIPVSYSPARNNNELEPDSLDDLNQHDQSLWPIQ